MTSRFSVNEVFTDEDETVPRAATELTYRREGLAAPTRGYLRVRSVAGSGQDRVTSLWSDPVTGSTFGRAGSAERAPPCGAHCRITDSPFREYDRGRD